MIVDVDVLDVDMVVLLFVGSCVEEEQVVVEAHVWFLVMAEQHFIFVLDIVIVKETIIGTF